MKKNLTKKALVPAIAMVIASVIALSGVTYAWFTTGTTASVSNLNVNVQTANGIQVSLDAKSWKSVLTSDDIVSAIVNATDYTNRNIQFPSGEIAPVSSAGNVVDGKMQMFYGEYNADGNLISVSEKEENGTGGNFVAFDLFFKSSSDQTLTLNIGTGMSSVSCIDMANQNAESEAGTDKAVRVAFVPMGSALTESGARSLTANGVKALIWEPNANNRAPGVEGTGKMDYYGFKTEFKDGVAENALGDGEVELVSTFVESQVILNMTAGISKVRVYIWLEGQDVDCINNISNGDFSVNLQFAVPEVTED